MPTPNPIQPLMVDDAIDFQSLFALNSSDPKDAVDVASKLSGMQRAKIAQFCYARAHMRQMGLHIAATCELPDLQRVFGAGAATIIKQARDVEATMSELNKSQYTKKPVTLRVVSSDSRIEDDEDQVDEA